MKQHAHIESLSDDGRGIARVNGKITFIEGALPQEDVCFQTLRQKRAFDEARVVSVEHPSVYRVQPRCEYFGTCGGCALQHLDSTAQLQMKAENVWRVLKHIGKVEPAIKHPALQAEVWHYRHRARLHVQAERGKVRVGFKARREKQVVEVLSCAILSPDLAVLLKPLHHLIKQLQSPFSIQEILMVSGQEGVGLFFRTKKALSIADKTCLEVFAQEMGCEIAYEKPFTLTYPLTHHAFQMSFAPTDFTQVNVSADALMLQAIHQYWQLKPTDHVLDLFCGLGHFALFLAPFIGSVLGIEGEQSMVDKAKENARRNQHAHLAFMCANLEHPNTLNGINLSSFTKVILDPPRAGAAALMQWIGAFRPQSILYISCHPATLARDAQMLVYNYQYKLTQATVVDMFPQTAHIEVMAWFEKQ